MAGTHILALINDLFFGVRVEEVARRHGYGVRTVPNAAAFGEALGAERPALAIVSLGEGDPAIDVIREASHAGIPVLAFGPHVDVEAHQAAHDAGARTSVTNSQLVRELAALIQEIAKPRRTNKENENG
jgi:DNA-binding response OmpR family regulator